LEDRLPVDLIYYSGRGMHLPLFHARQSTECQILDSPGEVDGD
jgi:hypothetical protein